MSERLSADDWTAAGLRALVGDGFPALKADVLARRLGVSRGSFYWHFADLAAFHRAVLARWRETQTAAVIRAVEAEAGTDVAVRLRALLRRAFAEEARLEVAVRAWAASDRAARAAVTAVDRRRLAYIEGLLRAAGVAAPVARIRARVMYWAYLGAAFAGQHMGGRALDQAVADLAGLAEGRDGGGKRSGR